MNEQLNEIYCKQKRLWEDISVLKRFISEKQQELEVLNVEYKRIEAEIHKPDFTKISKKELVKCFDHKIKASEVWIQVQRTTMYQTVKNVRELETETELSIRLFGAMGTTDPICIVINEDRSFEVLDKKEQE